jgi:hypothetical protein
MSSLRYRANGWDLRFRDRDGRQRTERFAGGTSRRAPSSALERKAEVEVELQLYRGSYVAREVRETRFRLLYQRWRTAGRSARRGGTPTPSAHQARPAVLG